MGVMPWDFHRLTPKVLRVIQGAGKDPLLERLRDKARATRALTMARLMTLSMRAADGQTG